MPTKPPLQTEGGYNNSSKLGSRSRLRLPLLSPIEIGLLERGRAEVRAGEVGLLQVRLEEADASEVRPLEANLLRDRAAEILYRVRACVRASVCRGREV